jgi:uncharacterized protein YjbI with pentapeptide repeats
MASSDQTRCVPCPPGFGGYATCTPCSAGQYSSGWGTGCQFCSGGAFNGEGAQSCALSPSGAVSAGVSVRSTRDPFAFLTAPAGTTQTIFAVRGAGSFNATTVGPSFSTASGEHTFRAATRLGADLTAFATGTTPARILVINSTTLPASLTKVGSTLTLPSGNSPLAAAVFIATRNVLLLGAGTASGRVVQVAVDPATFALTYTGAVDTTAAALGNASSDLGAIVFATSTSTHAYFLSATGLLRVNTSPNPFNATDAAKEVLFPLQAGESALSTMVIHPQTGLLLLSATDADGSPILIGVSASTFTRTGSISLADPDPTAVKAGPVSTIVRATTMSSLDLYIVGHLSVDASSAPRLTFVNVTSFAVVGGVQLRASADVYTLVPNMLLPSAAPIVNVGVGRSRTQFHTVRVGVCDIGSAPDAWGTCSACPAGTFGARAGATSCSKCPAGTFSAAVGATNSSVCTACVPGEYSSAGASSCTACSRSVTGRTSTRVSFTATWTFSCVGGYYTASGPAYLTQTCLSNGTWVGADPVCEACPTGTTSGNAATRCLPSWNKVASQGANGGSNGQVIYRDLAALVTDADKPGVLYTVDAQSHNILAFKLRYSPTVSSNVFATNAWVAPQDIYTGMLAGSPCPWNLWATCNTGYAGDGLLANASAVRLSQPSSLAYDSARNFFVSDTGNRVIRHINTTGHITTLPLTNLTRPRSVAVDKNDVLYVADPATRYIWAVPNGGRGQQSILVGDGTDASAPDALTSFSSGSQLPVTPYAIAYHKARHSLLILDMLFAKVREIDLASNTLRTVLGAGITAAPNLPASQAPSQGEPALTQPLNSGWKLQFPAFGHDGFGYDYGTFSTVTGGQCTTIGNCYAQPPGSIAVSPADGTVLLAMRNWVAGFDIDGNITTVKNELDSGAAGYGNVAARGIAGSWTPSDAFVGMHGGNNELSYFRVPTPAGYYSSTGYEWRGNVTACSPGTTSSGFATSCSQCTNGQVAPAFASTSCTSCSAGYIPDQAVGGTACSPCPSGTYQSGFSCNNCSSGYFNPLPAQQGYSPWGSPCEPCSNSYPNNYISTSGAASCYDPTPPTQTSTSTATATATATSTSTATGTATSTSTSTGTATATSTSTSTSTSSGTSTSSAWPAGVSRSSTPSRTPSGSNSPSPTPSTTPSQTRTPSQTPSVTPSTTATAAAGAVAAVNISSATVTDSFITSATVTSANLAGASLSSAVLTGNIFAASLTGATVQGTLSAVSLSGVSLANATLSGGGLAQPQTGVVASGVSIVGATLLGAVVVGGQVLEGTPVGGKLSGNITLANGQTVSVTLASLSTDGGAVFTSGAALSFTAGSGGSPSTTISATDVEIEGAGISSVYIVGTTVSGGPFGATPIAGATVTSGSLTAAAVSDATLLAGAADASAVSGAAAPTVVVGSLSSALLASGSVVLLPNGTSVTLSGPAAVSGGTITTGATLDPNSVLSGSSIRLANASVTGATLSGVSASGGGLASAISGAAVTNAVISSAVLSSVTLANGVVMGATISSAVLESGTASVGGNSVAVAGAQITAGSISAGASLAPYAVVVSATGLTVADASIASVTLIGAIASGGGLPAGSNASATATCTGCQLTGASVLDATVVGNSIVSGSLATGIVSGGQLSGASFTTGSYSGASLVGGVLTSTASPTDGKITATGITLVGANLTGVPLIGAGVAGGSVAQATSGLSFPSASLLLATVNDAVLVGGALVSGTVVSAVSISGQAYTADGQSAGVVVGATLIEGASLSSPTSVQSAVLSGGGASVSGGSLSSGTIGSAVLASAAVQDAAVLSGSLGSGALLNLGTIVDGSAPASSGGGASGAVRDMTGAEVQLGSVSGGALTDGNLTGAITSPANLRSGTATDGTLVGSAPATAGLLGPNGVLSGLTLVGVTVSGAEVSNAALSGATITGAAIKDADLSGANVGAGVVVAFPSPSPSSTPGVAARSAIQGAAATTADISGASLTSAAITGGTLSGASATSATLTGASITGPSLVASQITGVGATSVAVAGAAITGGGLSGPLSGASAVGSLSSATIDGATVVSGGLTAGFVSSGSFTGTVTPADGSAPVQVTGAAVSGGLVSSGSITAGAIPAGATATLLDGVVASAVITSGSLNGAHVEGADLVSATAQGATLDHARVSAGSSSGMVLTNTTLTQGEVVYARLVKGDVNGTITAGAISAGSLSGADVVGSASVSGGSFTASGDLQGVSVTGVSFADATISASVLGGASVLEASVDGTRMIGATIANSVVLSGPSASPTRTQTPTTTQTPTPSITVGASASATPSQTPTPSPAPVIQDVLVAYSLTSGAVCSSDDAVKSFLDPSSNVGPSLRAAFAGSLGYNMSDALITGFMDCTGNYTPVPADSPVNLVYDPSLVPGADDKAAAASSSSSSGSGRLRLLRALVADAVSGRLPGQQGAVARGPAAAPAARGLSAAPRPVSVRLGGSSSSSSAAGRGGRSLLQTLSQLSLSVNGETLVVELSVAVPVKVAPALADFLKATMSGASAATITAAAAALDAAVHDPEVVAWAANEAAASALLGIPPSDAGPTVLPPSSRCSSPSSPTRTTPPSPPSSPSTSTPSPRRPSPRSPPSSSPTPPTRRGAAWPPS